MDVGSNKVKVKVNAYISVARKHCSGAVNECSNRKVFSWCSRAFRSVKALSPLNSDFQRANVRSSMRNRTFAKLQP